MFSPDGLMRNIWKGKSGRIPIEISPKVFTKKNTPDGHSKALPPRVHTTHEMHGSTLIFHSDSIKSCPLTQENVSAY